MKIQTVRKHALSLGLVTEEPHFNYASFRVKGKIFVTVPPDEAHIHVFLPEMQRELALKMDPEFLDKLTWGAKVVGVRVNLAKANPVVVKRLVTQAWESKAPKGQRAAPVAAAASTPVRGSCLCGRVRFELDGPAQFINHCHCTMCRKAHGAAFGSFLHADGRRFRWVGGKASIRNHESSPGNFRAFCRICGSNVPVLEDEGAHVIIPAGALDDDPGVRPVVHIHTASKAAWFRITDKLPQFADFPPDEFWSRYE